MPRQMKNEWRWEIICHSLSCSSFGSSGSLKGLSILISLHSSILHNFYKCLTDGRDHHFSGFQVSWSLLCLRLFFRQERKGDDQPDLNQGLFGLCCMCLSPCGTVSVFVLNGCPSSSGQLLYKYTDPWRPQVWCSAIHCAWHIAYTVWHAYDSV